MKITKAEFMRGSTDASNLIEDHLEQVAFVGRSNVGKSSLINSLTNNKKLARSSSTPGRTQEINYFLINDTLYFVDLPGYGYARGSFENRQLIKERIHGYLFESPQIRNNKVLLIVDANVGMTESDIEMFNELKEHNKDIIIVANKIDKVKMSDKQKNLNTIKKIAGSYPVIIYSSEKRIGTEELGNAIESGSVR